MKFGIKNQIKVLGLKILVKASERFKVGPSTHSQFNKKDF